MQIENKIEYVTKLFLAIDKIRETGNTIKLRKLTSKLKDIEINEYGSAEFIFNEDFSVSLGISFDHIIVKNITKKRRL